MALTRKTLKAMGLTDEQVETIIEAHGDTVDGLKAELGRYKADAEKLPGVQRELDALKNKGDDGWKDKHDALKANFERYKAEVDAKETRAAKERAYRAVLADANLSEKGIEKAVKYAAWDDLELDPEGNLKGSADHIKAVREEWAEYITTTTTKGADTANPPANNGGKPKKTKEEIMAIRDPAVRQAEIAKNPEAFGLKFD